MTGGETDDAYVLLIPEKADTGGSLGFEKSDL
jgi:hypothetical protein